MALRVQRMTTTTAAPPAESGLDELEHSQDPAPLACRDPRWARAAFWGLLAATTLFYLYGLSASGFANAFYSAAVQAGSDSWKALFYGSLDAGNAITVDKPPASLWVMALSVRLFGLNTWAILVPEVLMGVASVAVVHATVKRHFGAVAGLVGGLVLALTPVAVLMFRFNNPDALLTLLMALGAWATVRSLEKGSIRWFALAGVFLGLGFLTKTLQVMLVVPPLGLAWLLAADTTLRRRLVGAFAGVGAMVGAAGWWVAIVELVPASARPYIGGSQSNSFLELTFGYNGLGRLNGEETGSVGGGGAGGTGRWGETGLTRMFTGVIGGQISWLIPTALLLLVAGLVWRGRRPRTDLRRAQYVVWGGWLLVTGLTFSLMAGIFHEYYTVALAPAVAAVVGMGAAETWEHRSTRNGRVILGLAVLVAAVWSFVILGRTTAYAGWFRYGVLELGCLVAALLLVVDRLGRTLTASVIAGAVIAGLAGPAAFSATTVGTAYSGSIITAGPAVSGGSGFGGMRGGPGGAPPNGFPGQQGGTTLQPPNANGGQAPNGARGGGMGGLLDANLPSDDVVAALTANASDYRWVAATVGSQNAAGLQLGSGEAVMAIGGFNGSDPSPTLAQFQAYVAAGAIHYYAASGGGMGGGPGGAMGGSGTASQITAWVEQNFTAVTIGSQTFYDLTQPVSGSAS
jgi:4-amino-4-deoxy-L-arabinose transferase-like glycosyltransferase